MGARSVIAVVSLDALSLPRTERLLAEGRMPVLAGLRERAAMQPMADTDGIELLHGAVFFTLPTGRRPARTGRFYPFVWDPGAQRVEPDLRPVEDSIWSAASKAGRRVVLIDSYEGWPAGEINGAVLVGWQLHNRVTMRRLGAPKKLAAELRRAHGGSRTLDEVYGRPSLRMLKGIEATLAAAPGRVAAAVEDLVERVQPDLVWCHLVAAHVGGHLLWDSSQVTGGHKLEEAGLGDALDGLYELTDTALGRIVAAVGDDATLLVMSPVGMGPNASRSDLLPGMVEAVLRDGAPVAETEPSGLWRLRAAVPTGLRAAIARGMPDKVALRLASGLATGGAWSETKALAPPAEPIGAVQLNVRGREREGCVDPADVPALVARLREGLTSFVDRPGGAPAVTAVHESGAVLGEGPLVERFPDLLVEWNPDSATAVDAVVSPAHGVVRRPGGPGGATGRSANHVSGEAWVLAVPGPGVEPIANGTWRHVDIAPTVAALLDVELPDVDGEPRLRRA
jgi:predicted AlkP superfamily phosphohydrolase/phosphomutase